MSSSSSSSSASSTSASSSTSSSSSIFFFFRLASSTCNSTAPTRVSAVGTSIAIELFHRGLYVRGATCVRGTLGHRPAVRMILPCNLLSMHSSSHSSPAPNSIERAPHATPNPSGPLGTSLSVRTQKGSGSTISLVAVVGFGATKSSASCRAFARRRSSIPHPSPSPSVALPIPFETTPLASSVSSFSQLFLFVLFSSAPHKQILKIRKGSSTATHAATGLANPFLALNLAACMASCFVQKKAETFTQVAILGGFLPKAANAAFSPAADVSSLIQREHRSIFSLRICSRASSTEAASHRYSKASSPVNRLL
mmetsp:Transcript_2019/g.4844  ORF Transcript_2019/g.4844 Transcript_2019/m.4844 type:complete len:311 (-) Transcript_2019:1985-2917(-)